jgi:hypothetical protein
VYDDFFPSDGTGRMVQSAYQTWKWHFDQGDVIEVPTTLKQWGRSSADMGDSRPVPFFKDLINHGMKMAQHEDVVCYSNRDILVSSEMPAKIIDKVNKNGIALCWRRSFVPEHGRMYKDFRGGKRDGGIDVLAFKPQWWKEHEEMIPDFLIGREGYDYCLWKYAESLYGSDVYVDNVIGHEPHESFWKQNKKTNPGQVHNRSLARVFFARLGDKRALQGMA